jgi:hypothetical protein
VSSAKQLAANRRNARRADGPQTAAGLDACKYNALRHGLRSLQTVVPGESPDEWEAHRAAVVADLAPWGAVETALAELAAVKLWRLGRVVRHEADLIANATDEDEVLQAHEEAHRRRSVMAGIERTHIPTRADVTTAETRADRARERLEKQDEALRQLQALGAMKDEDTFEGWAFFEALRDDLHFKDDELERLIAGEKEGPFRARHARRLLQARAGPDDGDQVASLVAAWKEKRARLAAAARRLRAEYKAVHGRYTSALGRTRRARGLPAPEDLEKIERYEAHIERGLHKALDRLHDLQSARGAVAPRGPSLALALVQAGPGGALGAAAMGPFGSYALVEAQEEPEESAGASNAGGPGAGSSTPGT